MTTTERKKVDQHIISIGSIVTIKTDPVCIGEVYSTIQGRRELYEVILYDKRLRPMCRLDGSFKRKKFPVDICSLIDEDFRFNNDVIEIGDIICKDTTRKRYGVVIGFTHPDGMLSTSYTNGYNGTDMIDCVEIEKRGLRRVRDQDGNLRRFSTFNERVSSCEVDLWNRTGPKIVTVPTQSTK